MQEKWSRSMWGRCPQEGPNGKVRGNPERQCEKSGWLHRKKKKRQLWGARHELINGESGLPIESGYDLGKSVLAAWGRGGHLRCG